MRGWVGVVWSIGGMRAFAFGVEGKDQGDGRSVAAACDAMRACVAFRLSLDCSRGRVPPARYTHRQPECVVIHDRYGQAGKQGLDDKGDWRRRFPC